MRLVVWSSQGRDLQTVEAALRAVEEGVTSPVMSREVKETSRVGRDAWDAWPLPTQCQMP